MRVERRLEQLEDARLSRESEYWTFKKRPQSLKNLNSALPGTGLPHANPVRMGLVAKKKKPTANSNSEFTVATRLLALPQHLG